MKAITKAKLEKYNKTLVEAVKLGTKYSVARKVLAGLPTSYAIATALEEIEGKEKHYKDVYRNTVHNIAVLELKEGI